MILVIDNYDSFVYNLVQYIGTVKKNIKVVRNDELTVEQVARMKPEAIIVSPGPGRPEDAGICIDLFREFSGKIPMLGVCLGHQCLAVAYGAKVVRAKDIYHGKVSTIRVVRKSAIFNGLGPQFQATRYHSLVIEPKSVASPIAVTAKTADRKYIMGIEIKGTKVYGVQFHPESIETHVGMDLIHNFLKIKK